MKAMRDWLIQRHWLALHALHELDFSHAMCVATHLLDEPSDTLRHIQLAI